MRERWSPPAPATRWAAPVVLVVLAAVSTYVVIRHNYSAWGGANFGMFAGVIHFGGCSAAAAQLSDTRR